MVEQNPPQAQAIESGIQQLPYGVGGSPSGYQSTGSNPSQAFQQSLTRELAVQQNPGQQQPTQQSLGQQQPTQQIPGQQSLGQQQPTQQSPAQQSLGQQQPAQQVPAQQSLGQQQPTQQVSAQQIPGQRQPTRQSPGEQGAGNPSTQQNPQGVEQQSLSGRAQQRAQQPQTGANQSWYQSTLTNAPSDLGSAQSTGHGTSAQSSAASPAQSGAVSPAQSSAASPAQSSAASPAQSGAASPAQPHQSQQLQEAGQPQFTTPTSAGPYGSQSAMMQSPTMAAMQGPSVQSPVSEFSAGDTAGTQFRTASSAGPEWEATESQQAPSSPSGYEQAVAQELRAAVDGLDQLANAAEWAGTRFAQQGNADASRACEDVHDRSHTVADFILRGSPFAASAARELQATIGGATQELQRHSTSDAQEVLNRAQQANQLLEGAIPRLSSAASATQ